MSTVTTKITVAFSAHITLDESAARALEAMAGYGTDEFLKVFYQSLGRHYMQPYEKGLRSLLDTVKESIPQQLHAIDKARAAIAGAQP